MSTYCRRHVEELSAGVCRSCQYGYCARCLVFSFGRNKPPFCIGCAIRAGGVRNTGISPRSAGEPAATIGTISPLAAAQTGPVDKRAERAYRRAEKAATRAAARASRKARSVSSDPTGSSAAPSSQVPAPSSLRSGRSK